MEIENLVEYYNSLYNNLEIPESFKTLWLATKPILNTKKWFKKEKDVLEYIKLEVEKRNKYIESLSKELDDIEFLDTLLPGITRYDYLGDFFGAEKVIIKSNLIYTEKGFIPTYISIITKSENNNLKMLKKTENDYVWHEYIKVNELDQVYDEFDKENNKTYTLK